VIGERSAALARAAKKLAEAAKANDEPGLDHLLTEVESSCMKCHAKFRKDLVNN
jgi:cytochrome c556